MRIELHLSGTMVIRADNELEGYALRKWVEESLLEIDGKKSFVNIIVSDLVPITYLGD